MGVRAGFPKSAAVEENTNRETIVREHGLEQRQRVGGIVAEEARRLPHRFAGLDPRGEVHHRVELADADRQTVEPGAVADVADQEFGAGGHRVAMSVAEVVVYDDGVSGVEQLRGDHAADVTSAARDHHFHSASFSVTAEAPSAAVQI
jgi:hypothetical protein